MDRQIVLLLGLLLGTVSLAGTHDVPVYDSPCLLTERTAVEFVAR